MNYFYPDIYVKDIYKINYKKLKEDGIKCLLFDLDNTLVNIKAKRPTKKIKELFAYLDDLEFKIIILSNSGKKRLEPFKEELNVDCAYSSKKPLSFKYKKIMRLYGYKACEIACIGDQLMTDVFGANRMGFLSIFIDKLADEDFITTKFNRFLEKKVIKFFNKRGMFTKGEYYE